MFKELSSIDCRSKDLSALLNDLAKVKRIASFRANLNDLTPESAEQIAALLRNRIILPQASFDLSSNPLGATGCSIILQSCVGKALSSVTLQRNALDSNSLTQLSPLFQQLDCLTLDLSQNPLSGIVAIAFPQHLQKLKLVNCQLQDKDASPLGRALAKSQELVTLDITDNQFTIAGIRDLLQDLIPLPLRHLSIAMNSLKQSDIPQLLKCLDKLPHLHTVNVTECQFDDFQPLLDWYEKSPVRKLNLGKLGVNEEVRNRLQIIDHAKGLAATPSARC
jgi:Ran GTPase-activating protein (RanGAP) involved in mRNA processing and transport